MKSPRIHSVIAGTAFFAAVALCLTACAGNGEGGGVGNGNILNVNYKFSVYNVKCTTTWVIIKNSGTFPANETVSFQGISGTVSGTVALSTDKTQLTTSFPANTPSGKYNVQLADDGRVGTMAYTGCGS